MNLIFFHTFLNAHVSTTLSNGTRSYAISSISHQIGSHHIECDHIPNIKPIGAISEPIIFLSNTVLSSTIICHLSIQRLFICHAICDHLYCFTSAGPPIIISALS